MTDNERFEPSRLRAAREAREKAELEQTERDKAAEKAELELDQEIDADADTGELEPLEPDDASA